MEPLEKGPTEGKARLEGQPVCLLCVEYDLHMRCREQLILRSEKLGIEFRENLKPGSYIW